MPPSAKSIRPLPLLIDANRSENGSVVSLSGLVALPSNERKEFEVPSEHDDESEKPDWADSGRTISLLARSFRASLQSSLSEFRPLEDVVWASGVFGGEVRGRLGCVGVRKASSSIGNESD